MSVIIGLTGGIASGKSYVSSILATKPGVRIIDMDLVAREAVKLGTPGLEGVIEAFGREYLLPDGTLNRSKLGAVVFADPRSMRVLEEILHPHIDAITQSKIQEAQQDNVPIIIIDNAMLVESGQAENLCEFVIVIKCEVETQIQRLMARNGLNREAALQRIHAQMSNEERMKYATFFIDNRGTLLETHLEIERLFAVLQGAYK